MLGLGLGPDRGARLGGGRRIVGLAGRPERNLRGRSPACGSCDEEELRIVPAVGAPQVSARMTTLRLQPLGAVHRHHADLAARDVHVALDLGPRRGEPGEEALEAAASRSAR